MEPFTVCALCESTVLSATESEYVVAFGKNICVGCVEALRSKELLRACPDPGPGKVFVLRPNRPFVCSVHDEVAQTYCSTCDSMICKVCGQFHKSHVWLESDSVISEVETMFEHVHYLACHSVVMHPTSDRLLRELIAKIDDEFRRAAEEPQTRVFQSFGALHRLYSELIELNPVLWGLSPRSNYHLIRKQPYSVPLHERFIHWAEWSGCSLHLYNLQTHCMISQQMAPGFVFPLYCRSLFLMDGTLFLCGGRKNLESHGLRKSWFINLTDWSINPGPKSLLGHANHSIQLFENSIYVLGGCNHSNQFTRECEILNLSSFSWSRLPDMLEVRDSLASIVDKRQRKIYAFGGRHRAGGCHDSIECFVVSEHKWVLLNLRLNYPVYMHGVVQIPFDGRYVVFGGLNEDDTKTGRAMVLNESIQCTVEINRMVSVGCITDEVKVIGNDVIVPVFYGYASRQMNKLDLKTLTWILL